MHRRARRLALIGAVVATLAFAAPASAITNGQPDNGEHPQVGQLFFYVPSEPDDTFTDGGTWFNCTGTLISATVVLTAGHCTFDIGLNGADPGVAGFGGNDVWVSFDEAPDYTGISSAPYIPNNTARYNAWTAILDAPDSGWHRGTAYPHPDFDSDAPFLADAGVVLLDDPQPGPYARLAPLDYLEQFKGKAKAQTLFEAVGYGLEYSRPKVQLGGDTRRKSEQVITNWNGVYGVHDKSSIVFGNNNGAGHRGGTCSGDSGGPFFLNNTLLQVAINSYGVPPNCTGGDGAYRIDQPDDVAWLAKVLAGTDPRFDD
jgi:hypothetical protein